MGKNSLWKQGFVFSVTFHLVLVSCLGILFAGSYQHQPPKESFFDVALDLQTGGGGGGGGGQADKEVVAAPPLERQTIKAPAVEQHRLAEQIEKNDVVETVKETVVKLAVDNSGQTAVQETIKKAGGRGTGSGGGHSSGRGTGTGSGMGLGSGSGIGTGHGSGVGSGTGSGQGPGHGKARAAAIEKFVRAVERNKGSYPYMALKQSRQGVAYIYVKLNEAGSIDSYYVATSSGDKSLDEAAMRAIQKTSPFAHGLGEALSLTVPVRWTIN